MIRWAVLLLLLTGCAVEVEPVAVPQPPAIVIPDSLTRCPGGAPALVPPPAPRTPDQIARWGIGTETARQKTEAARRECERRLRALGDLIRA
jgi:hypothetical protein